MQDLFSIILVFMHPLKISTLSFSKVNLYFLIFNILYMHCFNDFSGDMSSQLHIVKVKEGIESLKLFLVNGIYQKILTVNPIALIHRLRRYKDLKSPRMTLLFMKTGILQKLLKMEMTLPLSDCQD